MSKPDDNDPSPPLIIKETTTLLESMESNEENIYKTKCILNHKQTYYEQLQQQHENRFNKSITEKRAALSIKNDRSSLINTKNVNYRDKGNKICASYNADQQHINESEPIFSKCEDQIDMSKSLDQRNAEYEKQIDELINLLNQTTEKRKTKLAALELEEKKLREEHTNTELILLEKRASLINDESDSSDSGDLENELAEIQTKLTILNENYSIINEEDKSNEVAKEEFEKKYHESVYQELEAESADVTKEIEQLYENLDKQKATKQETAASYQTLEEYEKKLNEELAQTTAFWEKLERDQYGGFSELEQKIGEIKADIIKRNEQYGAGQDEKTTLTESLQKRDDEIQKLNCTVEHIATELKEVENLLETLKSTDDLSEQYNDILNKISDLHNERNAHNKTSLEKEEAIQNVTNQLNKGKEKGDLEMLTLENKNALETKELEKQYADIEAAKTKLESEVKSVEQQIKKFEDVKADRKEKSENLAKNFKDVDDAIEEVHKNLKLEAMKNEEAKRKLASFAALPPTYVKKNEAPPQIFAKPRTPSKKSEKKIPSPKAKRNWDSDSSVEGEVVKLKDILKKKQRRQQQKQDSEI